MARRQYKRLTAAGIKQLASRPGTYPDGDNLYLQVNKRLVDAGPPPTYEAGAASWVFRYLAGKKERYLGLGPLRHVSLAEARQKADAARRLWRDDGVDPIDARHGERQDRQLKAAKAMTFKQCAEAYIAGHSAGWRNPQHAKQWPQTLGDYVYPIFGDLPVGEIDTTLVMKTLQPIWSSKTETASRVRARIENVLDWATAREYRQGENPARWKGHLQNLLPKPEAAKKVARKSNGGDEHHAALPYGKIGSFMAELRQQEGVSARALEFLILTAARTGEVLEARWEEIDLAEKLWTIPASRMKADKEHRVPLCDAALAIIEAMAAIRDGDLVFFPGRTACQPTVMLKLMRRMGRHDVTVHGFRSSFSDWCAERTNFPSEVREMALAHAVGSAVEAAYRRGDLFAKRRQLAAAWAKYCGQPSVAAQERGKVIAIGAR
jgi:integrase